MRKSENKNKKSRSSTKRSGGGDGGGGGGGDDDDFVDTFDMNALFQKLLIANTPKPSEDDIKKSLKELRDRLTLNRVDIRAFMLREGTNLKNSAVRDLVGELYRTWTRSVVMHDIALPPSFFTLARRMLLHHGYFNHDDYHKLQRTLSTKKVTEDTVLMRQVFVKKLDVDIGGLKKTLANNKRKMRRRRVKQRGGSTITTKPKPRKLYELETKSPTKSPTKTQMKLNEWRKKVLGKQIKSKKKMRRRFREEFTRDDVSKSVHSWCQRINLHLAKRINQKSWIEDKLAEMFEEFKSQLKKQVVTKNRKQNQQQQRGVRTRSQTAKDNGKQKDKIINKAPKASATSVSESTSTTSAAAAETTTETTSEPTTPSTFMIWGPVIEVEGFDAYCVEAKVIADIHHQCQEQDCHKFIFIPIEISSKPPPSTTMQKCEDCMLSSVSGHPTTTTTEATTTTTTTTPKLNTVNSLEDVMKLGECLREPTRLPTKDLDTLLNQTVPIISLNEITKFKEAETAALSSKSKPKRKRG